jgi:NCS2 family nucleobase:cation symporter-2
MHPAGLTYGVDETPPPLQLLLLAVQYAVMIAIYLVLVVIVLRHADVSQETRVHAIGMALIAAAIGTALQSLRRGPVGSGFLAPPVYSAIYLAPSILAAEKGGLPLVFGMTIFAGLVEIVIGLLVQRLRLVFTHVVSGLTVFLVGLQLGVVGVGELLDVRHEDLPNFHLHVGVSVLTLGAAIALSIWGRGSAKLLCSLIGLVVGLFAAALIGLITPETVDVVRSASWAALP